MRCPFCRELDNKVVDSRLSREGDAIRRRRVCLACDRRFTTHERVEQTLPKVVKKDGRREDFDRGKILVGLTKACEKRPVSVEAIERVADRIERTIQETGDGEIASSRIGEAVMEELYQLDKVAYVRFASVYRSFRDLDEFLRELQGLVRPPRRAARSSGRSAKKTSR
jgi:transcriptional repressor NrdR